MLDQILLVAQGGHGGNGIVSFRRERYVPRGGPDGGDGGAGGSVVLVAHPALRTLDDLRGKRVLRARDGGVGRSQRRHGRRGEDLRVPVPAGTVVWKVNGRERQLADLQEAGAEFVVARGGTGGRGNGRMATSIRQTPRFAEQGLLGEQVKLRLEVRLLAEVGLVGLPNAGKSSLLSAVSAARPKVAGYPFTTLEPHLGMANVGYDRMVFADIPGLIEGAHEGAGLGIAFLQHVRRTRVLVHVVDTTGADPAGDIEVVRRELEAYGHGLREKRWLVALNKVDVPEGRELAGRLHRDLQRQGVKAYEISALSREGVPELLAGIQRLVGEERRREEERRPAVVETLRPKPVDEVVIKRTAGGFEVRSARAREAAAKLGGSSDEARHELTRRLRRMGVMSALRRAGVKDGDLVRVGGVELTWPI